MKPNTNNESEPLNLKILKRIKLNKWNLKKDFQLYGLQNIIHIVIVLWIILNIIYSIIVSFKRKKGSESHNIIFQWLSLI